MPPTLQPEGPECTCGNRLEALASERTVLQFLRTKGSETAGRCTRLCAWRRAKRQQLVPSLAGLCRHRTRSWPQSGPLSNLLNPKKVLLSPWRKYSFSTAADDCHLTAADDCDLIVDPVDLWARGAACLAIQHLVNSARI